MMARLFLLMGLLTAAPASAWGQGPPPAVDSGELTWERVGVEEDDHDGDALPVDSGELTWERVGDRPVDPRNLAFDGAGVLYAVNGLSAYALDLSAGFPGVWTEHYKGFTGFAFVALGPDTLVVAKFGTTRRSTDGGVTWPEVYAGGTWSEHGLYEAPAGTPLAGTLFVGHGLVAASTDRGATWEVRGDPPQGRAESFAALSTGRLVAGASWGGIYSDDAGYTWVKSDLWQYARYLLYDVAVVEGPGGAERVIAAGADATAPHIRAWHSDDGGETWHPEAGVPLPQVDNGVGRGVAAVLSLGGSSALVVLGRDSVYRTDDGGQTWAEVGHVPDVDDDIYAQIAVLGPDGRLYVGLKGLGTLDAWVWRTEAPVPVASEPGPAEKPEGLGLWVRPNPAQGRAEVVVRLPEAGEVDVSVYDVLGRRAAVVHAGRLGAGEHALALDVSGLPAGVYVVRVTVGGAVATRTVTVLR